MLSARPRRRRVGTCLSLAADALGVDVSTLEISNGLIQSRKEPTYQLPYQELDRLINPFEH